MNPRRIKSLLADCPKCGAKAGVACEGKRGARKAPHKQRLTAPPALVRVAPPQPSGDFYQSDEWRRLRYKALKQHGGACQCCGAIGSRGKPLHVDHIKPRSRFPELALSLSNLQVLCIDCNLGKSAWDDTDWRRGEAS